MMSPTASTSSAAPAQAAPPTALSRLGVNIIQSALRPERPCDLCRKRKVKCFLEAGDPACARCRTSGRACTFEEPPIKRQRYTQEGSEHHPQADKPTYHPPHASTPVLNGAAPLPVPMMGALPVASASTSNAPNFHSLPPLPDSSQGFTSIEPAPSPSFGGDDEPTLNLYNESTIEHVGPSGDTGANYLHTNGFKVPGEEDGQHLSHRRNGLQRTVTQDDSRDPVHFRIVGSPQSHSSLSHPAKNPMASYDASVNVSMVYRILQTAGLPLVDVYLLSAHRAFPIVNPERVKARLQRFVSANRDPGPSDRSLFVFYVSLMIVGYHWQFLLPATGASNIPELDVSLLRNFCKQALPRELCMPRLVTIQSILLEHALLVSTHAGDSTTEIWAACGNLITAAQNLGLHRNPDCWNIAKWEIEIRKKLWWAVYITEKWLAYSLGRPSLIQGDDWTVTPLTPSDFEGSYDQGAARFVAMADLTCIVSDVHSTLFTSRDASRLAANFEETKACAAPLSQRLDAWYGNRRGAMEAADLDTYRDGTEEVQSPCSLQLAYFAVRVAIHRALLRCGTKADKTIRTDAVKTMREIAEWAKKITSQDVVSVWWGCAGLQLLAITNFFLSLTISAPSEEEFRSQKKIVQTWRWHLRINLQSFPRLAKSALQRVDEFFQKENKLDMIWQYNKYKTPRGTLTRAVSPSAGGSEGNTMLDLARLASRLNDVPSNQLQSPGSYIPIPQPSLGGTDYDAMQNSSFENLLSADNGFNFQLPNVGLDNLDADFSLEQFMSWGSPNTGQTGGNIRLSEQSDWVL